MADCHSPMLKYRVSLTNMPKFLFRGAVCSFQEILIHLALETEP